MINSSSCLMDNESIIKSSDMMYKFGIVNGFWTWLNKNIQNGHVIILRSVYNSLTDKGKNMTLSKWSKKYLSSVQYNEIGDKQISKNIRKIANYVNDYLSNVYSSKARASWMSSTGLFLVATAMKYKCVIVTGGTSGLFHHGDITQTGINTDDEISTHDIANHFKVHCINLYDLEEKFNLQLN